MVASKKQSLEQIKVIFEVIKAIINFNTQICLKVENEILDLKQSLVKDLVLMWSYLWTTLPGQFCGLWK